MKPLHHLSSSHKIDVTWGGLLGREWKIAAVCYSMCGAAVFRTQSSVLDPMHQKSFSAAGKVFGRMETKMIKYVVAVF